MKRIRLAAVTVMALFLLLTVGATNASADVFQFTSCHITTAGGCGLATGTVGLTQSGTSVIFDIALTDARFVSTGAAGGFFFAFNDTVSGSTITDITYTLNGVNQSTISGGLTGSTGSVFHADGFGDFSAGVGCATDSSCNGASTPNVNDLHFTVTNETIAQLTASAPYFIADVYVTSAGPGNGNTGLIDVSMPGSVPDGGMTLMLLGGALVGLEGLRRRVRA